MEMELREGIASKIAVPPGCRDVLVFDTKQPGFFLRKFAPSKRFPAGAAMYGVKYWVGGKARQMHLCEAARGTLAKARGMAMDVRAKARLGTDTLGERRAAKVAAARAVALLDVAKKYLEAK